MKIHSRGIGALLAVAMVALLALGGVSTAQAAPAGAATNLTAGNQLCSSAGVVQVTIYWTPSGQGDQWLDVSLLSNFAGFGNQGPYASNVNGTTWNLSGSTTYYARVTTFTPQGPRTSDTLQFQTINCGAFSPPSNVNAAVHDDFVRISWTPGNGNLWFCVDTAFSQSDLTNITGSWHNWGCGTTGNTLDLDNLACGKTHYFRVWAAGSATPFDGYSEVGSFTSQDCNFSPPTNPSASVASNGNVHFDWDGGTNNDFYCIDLALSQDDLTNTSGTWSNAACGTTTSSATVPGLVCGERYYFRIWATGGGTSGYSPVATVNVPSCSFQAPDNLNANVEGDGHVVFTWNQEDTAIWFCVDVAGSESDLLNFGDSWTNFNCGVASETADVTSDYFDCGETYYWRVFAYAGSRSGHSEVASFEMTC